MNWHRIIYGFMGSVLLLCLLMAFNGSISYSKVSSSDPETTELVIKLNPLSNATIEAINATYNTVVLESLMRSTGIYRLQIPFGSEAEELAEQMNADMRLLYAEPNFASEAPEGDGRFTQGWGGEDPAPHYEQYATKLLRLADAHRLRRGAGVVVAVLDTGLQLDHPIFTNALTPERYDYIDDDNIPEDEPNNVDDDGDSHIDEAWGHGTHVAGIIRLVAPEAKIMPLRVLDAEGRGNIFMIAEAILYAVQNGADVINLSLGSSQESDMLEDLFEDVTSQYNVVLVAAAGNLNSSMEQYPAADDSVLAVTAIDATNQKADFANYGDWIDVVAPGISIYSATPPSSYAWWSGSSMAVPFVAGQAALIYSAVPTLPGPNVMMHIKESAQTIAALNPGFEQMLGNGRIDIGHSLQSICDASGNCTAPDLTGKLELEIQAIVENRPAGLHGIWRIGGIDYIANGITEFEEEYPLVVGACAKVEYRNTQPFTILEIEGEVPYECETDATPTVTLMETMTVTPMAVTPTITTSLTSTSPTPTLLPSNTPSPTPRTPTRDSTMTPIPSSTAVSSPTSRIHTTTQEQVTQITIKNTIDTWLINDIAYTVTEETILIGTPIVGTKIRIESHLDDDGNRVAARIQVIGAESTVYLPAVVR